MKLLLFFMLTSLYSISIAEAKIWVIHDLVKINPQSATAYEAGHTYKTNLSENYKKENTIWNSSTQTISLEGLKDEVLGFQIIIESKNEIEIKDISFTNLKNGSKIINSKKQITIFNEWFEKITEPSFNKYHFIHSFGKGWYPNKLIPLNTKDLKKEFSFPLLLPSKTNNIPNQKAIAIWVDLHISEDAKPGNYNSTVKVILNNKIHNINLNLFVSKHILPKDNHSNFLAPSMAMRSLYIHEPERTKDINFLFKAHRVEFLPYKYYLETKGSGRNFKIFWDKHIEHKMTHLGSTNFMRDILPYLQDSMYTERNGYFGPAKNSAPA